RAGASSITAPPQSSGSTRSDCTRRTSSASAARRRRRCWSRQSRSEPDRGDRASLRADRSRLEPRRSRRLRRGAPAGAAGRGAGGGVVAGELAARGIDVLLLELGPHLTARDFTRWEAKATHDLWWPLRLAHLPDGDVVAFLAARCVGGTTTINTKVALRAHER